MPTLHERFADLAEDAPESPTPAGIWVEGRRRARVRRRGTALVAVVTLVLVALVGGLARHQAAAPGYSGQAGAVPALPTRIYEPSRWLSTSDGPPGQLSMVIPAKKGSWTGYRWGLVGVSATTGAYHFLDLRNCCSGGGVLSPDGRHVAYWLSGTSSGGRTVLDGLGIYDTVTGVVSRWVPRPGHPVNPNGLAWNGNDAVTFANGPADYRVSGHRGGYLWVLGQRAPRPIPQSMESLVGSAGQAGLYQTRKATFRFHYLEPGHLRQAVGVTLAPTHPNRRLVWPAVSPSGRRLAGVHATARHSQLLVGRVRRALPTHVTPLSTGLRWPFLVGWSDDQHLVVINQLEPTDYDGSSIATATYALERLDVLTGRITRMADMGHLARYDVGFATDLLSRPTVSYPAPPEPMDPRLELGLVVGLVLLGGVGIVLWRRRVRP